MIIRNKLRAAKMSSRIMTVPFLIVALIFIGTLSLFGFLIGGFVALVALYVLTGYDGIEVNAAQHRFRYVTGIFGFRFGKWTKIPELSRVSVMQTTDSVNAGSLLNSISGYRIVFLLRLHPQNTKMEKIIVGRYSRHDKATKDAEFLGEQFGVEVVQLKR